MKKFFDLLLKKKTATQQLSILSMPIISYICDFSGKFKINKTIRQAIDIINCLN